MLQSQCAGVVSRCWWLAANEPDGPSQWAATKVPPTIIDMLVLPGDSRCSFLFMEIEIAFVMQEKEASFAE